MVTLAKNAFWEDRPPAAAEHPLSGHLRVAAVRAKAPEPLMVTEAFSVSERGSGDFSLALLERVYDHKEVLSLHSNRSCLVFCSGDDFSRKEFEVVKTAVGEVLDHPNNGNNENPNRAGRQVFEAVGHEGGVVIVLMLHDYGRLKWYRNVWGQPIPLGARGLKSPPQGQFFDDGGECTLAKGCRLFFPGSLPFTKEPTKAEDLAHAWRGGKSVSYTHLTLPTTPYV